MTRKVVGAVVVVIAGLACSACGSSSSGSPLATTTSNPPSTVTLQVPLTRRVVTASGTGSKTIGTFAVRGKLAITFSCTGKGSFHVQVVTSPPTSGVGTYCPQTNLGPATGFGHGDRRAQIEVDAAAHSHWTVAVSETYPKLSTVPAGLQQLPIRRSGVGPASLGTFAMPGGTLYIAATCVGKGTFGVWWNENGSSGRCLNSRRKASVKLSSNFSTYDHRARIDIRAPAGMKWTVIVFEGPPDIGPHALNVWR